MSDGPAEPTAEPADPWVERRAGVLWVLALHLVFTGTTALVGQVAPGAEDASPLLATWLRWLGVLQGIYVFPACITAALVQRWQMLYGMLAAAAVTLAATLVGLALG